jgi:hypothetical protein
MENRSFTAYQFFAPARNMYRTCVACRFHIIIQTAYRERNVLFMKAENNEWPDDGKKRSRLLGRSRHMMLH